MRCYLIFLVNILLLCSSKSGQSQGISDSLSKVKTKQELPVQTLKSKFRIQLFITARGEEEKMMAAAKEANLKYRLNSYILRQNEWFKLQVGNYSEKKYAKQRLSYIRKKFPKAKIVKAENDSIVFFILVAKRKPVKNNSNPSPSEKQKKEYSIRIDPPLVPADTLGWKDLRYATANTANNEEYLSLEEKKVYYYLNLVRMNPKLFADTYLKHLRNSTDPYESSLYRELQKLTPKPILKPNRKLWESAHCHAVESGKSGYTGHERTRCTKYFMGECCQYGTEDALSILINLLIDQGVSSLGHRKICLSDSYTELGVSIQPHKTYRVNTVMDFR